MSKQQRRIFWPCFILIVIALTILVLVSASTRHLIVYAKQNEQPPVRAEMFNHSPPAARSNGAAVDRRADVPVLAGMTEPPANAQDAAQKGEPLTAIQITLQPHGFEPSQLSRTRGPFVLVLRNRSGLDETALQVESSQGAHVRDVRLPRNRTKWSAQLDLPTGEYTLTETNHTDWIFHLTIR